MRLRGFILSIFFLFSAWSGISTLAAQYRFLLVWQRASLPVRNQIQFGPYWPVIEKVDSLVPRDAAIVLFSELDPALLPYYLYPRKFWQIQTDPETNSFYMHLPFSQYPLRHPDTFKVDWYLYYRANNASAGGELVRAGDHQEVAR